MSSNYNEYIYNIYEAFLHKQDVAKEVFVPSRKCRIYLSARYLFQLLVNFQQEIRTREMIGGPTHILLFGQMVYKFFKRGNFFITKSNLENGGFSTK